MEENGNVQEKEIDLRILWNVLRRNLATLIVAALIFAAGAFFVSKFLITKQYEADATLIVNNLTDDKNTINTSELQAARNLADVYSIIIKSDTILQDVIDNLKLSLTYDELRNMVSVSSVNATQVINVTVTNTDPKKAKAIVSEIVKIAPPIIKDRVEAGSVEIISEAKISNNGNPVSPKTARNTAIGGLAGFVLMFAVVLIKELSNNTFKTEEDITEKLNMPLLGVIPAVDVKEFNKNV
ncbi:MAG: hypothetical protein IJ192_06480 [Clostridia bacterium]|nr:hypothetical protein [Clostridia bacterium]